MKDRIKLSDVATYHLDLVKKRLRMSGQDDYIPIRIAFGRSIQTNVEPVVPDDVIGKSSKRKELALTTFEQQQGILFQALLTQKYKRKIEEDEYVDTLTKHIEHGLYIIALDTERLSGYDYLVTVTSGKKFKEGFNLPATSDSNFKHTDVLKLHIGKAKDSKQDIDYAINMANNPHVAIMGAPGSGKTFFLKHLLREIRKKSNFNTNFVIFDYKDGDIATDKSFATDCRAEVIDLKERPLPINVFVGVGDDDKEQKSRAERIVELVKNVEANIGKVQENNLYQAILSSYQQLNANSQLGAMLSGSNIATDISNENHYPDFTMVRTELERINPRPDSLTSVLRPLIDLHYFAERHEPIYQDWVNRTEIIDIHQIERKELVVFFVLNQIHKELKKLGTAPADPVTGARQIRTVIVIDEAHYFLGNKKRAKILADMIRDIRSAGGAVILASQSPDDYDKDDFDYLELMEYAVVLKSTPSSSKFLQQKFSISATEAKELLKKIGKLNKGDAFVLHDNKVLLSELCK